MTLRTFIGRLALFVLLFAAVDFFVSEALLLGLCKYYGFDSEPDILINGTSGTISAISKAEIERATRNSVALFAREGVSVDDRLAMVDYFYSEHPRSVKTVIYEIDPKLFSLAPAAANVYTQFLPFMDNEIIDLYIRRHASDMEYFISRFIRMRRYDVHFLKMAARGFLGYSENPNTGMLDTIPLLAHVEQKGTIPVEMHPERIRCFEKTMELIRENGAEVLLVMIPMHYLKHQTFEDSSMKRFYRYFEEYQKTNPNVEFLDFNAGHITIDATLFHDPVHMNRRGQKAVSGRLIGILNGK
ncbi:MAG: hypothetical protein ACM3Q4_14740 [Acidobacteriota bacterium]